MTDLPLDSLTTTVSAMAGAVTWTLIEYCVHRWLGHEARFRPNFFSYEHTRHHSEGNYFSPLWKKILVAVLVLSLLGVPAYYLLDWYGLIYISGLVAAYLTYEYFHYAHHVHPGATRYGRRMRRHHFYHHFSNPRANHGVTSTLWDHVFGTYEPVTKVIKVPRKLSMYWLIDPQSDEVYSEHAHWYVLMGRSTKKSAKKH